MSWRRGSAVLAPLVRYAAGRRPGVPTEGERCAAAAGTHLAALEMGSSPRAGPPALQGRFSTLPAEAQSPSARENGVRMPVLEMAERAGANPFAIVQEEINAISERMRQSIVSEVPVLKQAAEYFFRKGSEGKRFRPTMLLLMASALSAEPPSASMARPDSSSHSARPRETRRSQQRISEITEMIHVASLLHDDVIDTAETRRGVMSLNSLMGNKLAVLAGDFLLARASVTLASLHNAQVVELMSLTLEHLVSGEVMQMTETPDMLASHDHYQEKTFFKTASLLAHSAKSVAVLGGHEADVCDLAYAYGRHVGLAFQYVDDVLDFTGSALSLGKPSLSDLKSGLATAPVLYAAEEFPGLGPLIRRKFKHEGDVQQALLWVEQSRGIERTQELAAEHVRMAQECIAALPLTREPHAIEARQGLIDLTHRVLNRSKYLLFEIIWKDGKVDESFGGSQMIKLLRESVQLNFGDCGAGMTAASMQVKYMSPLTGLCVLRCSRESHRMVWGALTLVSEVKGRPLAARLLHVGGTVRSCQRAALAHDLRTLALLEEKGRAQAAATGRGGGGGSREARSYAGERAEAGEKIAAMEL